MLAAMVLAVRGEGTFRFFAKLCVKLLIVFVEDARASVNQELRVLKQTKRQLMSPARKKGQNGRLKPLVQLAV